MRMIKGLTVKQWLKILGLPALIAAEFALILAFSGDVVDTAAFMAIVFVFSICVAVYISSAVNAYHEFRGERMSREDMETEIKQLKEDLRRCCVYAVRTRKDLDEVRIELEKIRIMDLRKMARDKE